MSVFKVLSYDVNPLEGQFKKCCEKLVSFYMNAMSGINTVKLMFSLLQCFLENNVASFGQVSVVCVFSSSSDVSSGRA
jgi:hypothetical protein